MYQSNSSELRDLHRANFIKNQLRYAGHGIDSKKFSNFYTKSVARAKSRIDPDIDDENTEIALTSGYLRLELDRYLLRRFRSSLNIDKTSVGSLEILATESL